MPSPTSRRPLRFDSHFDLAELPWFEVRDGRLRLADRSLGPIADVHAHLALTYGRRHSVDLMASHPDTELYLPLGHALDLDVYANRNFDPDTLSRLKKDLGLYTLTSRGMRRTHTVPNLARDMDELGVAASVLLPIELPALSWNAETWLEATRGREDFACLGSVHPMERGAIERLRRQKELGARGVKLHPAVQLVRPDHPRAMEIYGACGELSLPVLWHCGPVGIETAAGRERSQVKHYWAAVREHPGTTFVLGHSGALQMDMALDLARLYPNVWLEISSQSVTNVRRIVTEGPNERTMLGSDWPFYSQAMPLAKLLLATEDREEVRRPILWENAARLFGLGA